MFPAAGGAAEVAVSSDPTDTEPTIADEESVDADAVSIGDGLNIVASVTHALHAVAGEYARIRDPRPNFPALNRKGIEETNCNQTSYVQCHAPNASQRDLLPVIDNDGRAKCPST